MIPAGHSRWRAWLLLAVLVFPQVSWSAEHRASSSAFTFAVLADLPFSTREEPVVASMLDTMAAQNVRFVVHLGDLRGPSEPCSDELFEIRKTLLDSSARPLVYLPGANDWIGCDDARASGSDVLERLARLREHFFSEDTSLGAETMPLARQSGVRRFHDFSENVRWQSGPVLFVAVDLPAPNNDFRTAGGRNGEFEDRTVANRAWLERAFAFAQSHHLLGVVVLCQGDPDLNRSLRGLEGRGARRDGFYEFKATLRELTEHFHGEVLLVHAATSDPSAGGVVEDAGTRQLKNLMEARAFASPDTQHWLEVEVDIRRAGLFRVRVASLPADSPAPVEPAH